MPTTVESRRVASREQTGEMYCCYCYLYLYAYAFALEFAFAFAFVGLFVCCNVSTPAQHVEVSALFTA